MLPPVIPALVRINADVRPRAFAARARDLDTLWHDKLMSQSKNARLTAIVATLRLAIERYERLYMADTELLALSVAQHAAIIKHLKRGDIDSCAKGARTQLHVRHASPAAQNGRGVGAQPSTRRIMRFSDSVETAMLKFFIGTALGALLSFVFVRFGLEPPAIAKLPEKLKANLVTTAVEADLYDLDAEAEVRERALKIYFDNRAGDAAKLDATSGTPFSKSCTAHGPSAKHSFSSLHRAPTTKRSPTGAPCHAGAEVRHRR